MNAMGFYARLRDKRGDDGDLQACIENVVEKLEGAADPDKPGMLLGKIQSGKTRAFLGVIARAFDHDYGIAIVLTKGTKTLATQTVRRIGRDFKEFVDNDEVLVFDIMQTPDSLTKAELRRKIVIVAKKEVRNLRRVRELFDDERYAALRERRVLLVDDEADMASVRFTRQRGDNDFDQGTIANQMDDLRQTLRIAFLQVTATPYALYLQPEDYTQATNLKSVFHPKRPAFTELLPIHSEYVGGEDYFGGHGADDPRYHLYVEVDEHEQDALRTGDNRVIREDRLWSSDNIKAMRRAIITFLIAIAIRQRQQARLDQPRRKYAMIIHNDTQRAAHDWQWSTVGKLTRLFEQSAIDDDPRLRAAFNGAYADLKASVEADEGFMPSAEESFDDLTMLLTDGELNIQKVNSDALLEPLLDQETAELRLRTKANIFIGGSILDRGITVPNLISFYYGRNPKRMQADTVLQHSRMYGARPRADLAVTRFYTSRGVYNRLVQIHSLETALRQAFLNGAHDDGVVFIQSDPRNGFVPCAPSKISASNLVAVRPGGILLPVGFDTIAQTQLTRAMRGLDNLIPPTNLDAMAFESITLENALEIVDAIEPTLALNERDSFEFNAMKGLLRFYANDVGGRVLLLSETGRRLDKGRSGDRSGLSILGTAALRALVQAPRREPALILLKQNGGPDLGWKAGPFWWPMLASPSGVRPCVFATKTAA